MSALTHTTELVVLTCWCGMPHAVPTEMREHQLRMHREGRQVPGIYCPLGHNHVPSGPSKVSQLEAELQRKERTLANRDEDLRSERASHAATKGQLTKTKKRVAGGACPCCNRTFTQLGRHMASQHPEYVPAS